MKVEEVIIDEMIVHILDTSQPEPVLSEILLPLEGRPDLRKYFESHIKNSIEDSASKAAVFKEVGGGGVAEEVCLAVMEGRQTLVEGSQALARSLFAIMAKDGRISAGDLAVCLFRTGSDSAPHLGLLKIDPSPAYAHTVEERDGKRLIGFAIREKVMPSTKERLQKCAFVLPVKDRGIGYHMIVLDRQIKQLEGETAQFFLQRFLGAEQAMDDRQRTRNLYMGLIDAKNDLRKEGRIDSEEEEKLSKAIEVAVSSEKIEVDRFVEALPLPPDEKAYIKEAVSQKVPDREFSLDKEFAEGLIKRRRFRGKHGLKFEVDKDHFKDVVKEMKDVTLGGKKVTRVVLEVEDWKEVP
ncbi:MAG: nucleoid-associated protein [Methanotrichaceae archaeon]|nr:nucleoid-associated protein [Methanotrichaceae archaeon]